MRLTAACLALGLSLAAATPPLAAQPRLHTNEPVFKSGNWFVVRTTRERGDAVACTGFYKAFRGIQLSEDRLIVRTGTDMQSILVTYNDRARVARPPDDLEKEVRAVVFKGPDFDLLGRSKRLRITIQTPKGEQRHDLNLQGLREAVGNIVAGCPVPAERRGGATPAAGAQPVEHCSPTLMARMRAVGITEAQITNSCR